MNSPLSTFFVLRSFVFTFVCARVHKETIAPVNTLYRLENLKLICQEFSQLKYQHSDSDFFCRAYVKGDVAWHDYDLVKITHQRQYHTLECLSFIKLGKCHLLPFLSYLEEPTYLASLLYFDSNIIQILYSGKVVEDGI